MTRQETRPHSVPSTCPPRLKLTTKSRSAADVRGTWWPRSRDLGTELRDLLAALVDRMGPIERVVYDPADWAAAPEVLGTGDGAVILEAYRYESINKVYIYGITGAGIVLRVMPPATDDDDAVINSRAS